MTTLYNVAFELIDHLKNSDKTAFEISGQKISGRVFRNIIINFAMHMKKHGVNQDSCVALESQDIVVATALNIATGLIGCSWVRASINSLRNSELNITHMFYTSEVEYQKPNVITSMITPDWFKTPEGIDNSFAGYKNLYSTWMLAESSGTTGNVKFMDISFCGYYERVNNNVDIQFEGVKYITFLFHPLKSTTQYKVVANLLLDTPVIVGLDYESISNYPGIYVMGSHSQVSSMIRNFSAPSSPKEAIACLAGSATNKKIAEKFLKYFKHIVIGYGATETSRTTNKSMSNIEQFNGSAGKPFPDVEFKFEDGLVLVKTPPFRTISRYHSGETVDEWFKSGDYGYMKDGELYITGRINDQLNLGGVKIDPKPVEDLIRNIEGVDDCLIFQNENFDYNEQLCVIVVSKENVTKSIFDACLENLGISKTPKNIYYAEDIPRNDNGKPSRKLAMKEVENVTPVKYG